MLLGASCGGNATSTVVFTPSITPTPQHLAVSTPTFTVTPPATNTPSVTPTISSSISTTTYIVQAGDTLFGIAYQFGITVEELKYANSLQDDVIYPEQILQIPADSFVVTPTVAITTVWHPSILDGNLQQFYSKSISADRFLVHYAPETYPDVTSQMVVDMIATGLQHIESTLNTNLDGSALLGYILLFYNWIEPS